ncbi:thioredoxin family protein [Pontibacter brevis]
MFKKKFLLPIVATLLLSACQQDTRPVATTSEATTAAIPATFTAATPANKPAEKIQWLTMEQAAEKMKQEPRKILVDVYTDWCGWCKKMDKNTFTDPEVAAIINKHYYAVKLDAEGKAPITLKGHTFTFKPEYKAHELAVALLNGQMSFPTTVYLDEQMNMLTPVPGYLDAKSITPILRYFGEDHHKKMTWQEYEKKK